MLPTSPIKKTHTVKIVREVINPQATIPAIHHSVFQRISQWIATKAGSSTAFIGAILLVVVWGLTGPVFHFSETWQLFINTVTTIVTFLMVFAIQSTQNRDSKAIHLKLDELIKSNHGARAEFVDIEDLDDADLDGLHTQFRELHDKFQARAARRQQQ